MAQNDVDALLAEAHRQEQEDEELAALLTGPFQAVRDQNHVEADCVLVWDRSRHPVLESTPFHELTLRYPCGGEGDGWGLEELGKVVRAKGTLYRQSLAAHDLSEEDSAATPLCGTVVLIARVAEEGAHRWVIEKSAIKEGVRTYVQNHSQSEDGATHQPCLQGQLLIDTFLPSTECRQFPTPRPRPSQNSG